MRGDPIPRLPSGWGDALLEWFDGHGRTLPWRDTRDPWAILVAELMLQQTQVTRVIDRWTAFLEEFPDVEAVAAEAPAEIIRAWAGLGYNRRAINLHRTAFIIAADHEGRFPTALGDLLALPGVGPYTARAIRVFAYETDDAVLDTNVARILARSSGTTLTRPEAQRLADASVPSGRGWAWNQAMLDVGAAHCRARGPVCAGCPFAGHCTWHRRQHPEPDPASGSGGVSGAQSRFAGSDREGRGRLVAALRAGPVSRDRLATVMGWPGDGERAARVAARVVRDGLAVDDGEAFALPSAAL